MRLVCVFFFQAEDGIRDYKVTGVQTCALPIYELDIGVHAHGGGFDVRVNPYVQLVAQDGPDVMEAVALDWGKAASRANPGPKPPASFAPRCDCRNPTRPSSCTASPPFNGPAPAGGRGSPPKAR